VAPAYGVQFVTILSSEERRQRNCVTTSEMNHGAFSFFNIVAKTNPIVRLLFTNRGVRFLYRE